MTERHLRANRRYGMGCGGSDLPQDEGQALAADKAILRGCGLPDDNAEITAEVLA